MGILNFWTRIKQYGARRVIPQPGAESSQITPAIIDGPALAHNVFETLRYKANRSVVTQCNYAEVGHEVVEWLDKLALHGYDIQGIFFDGALPDHKKQTRNDRMQASIDKLVTSRNAQDLINKSTQGSDSDQLNANLIADGDSPAWTPPPFLVPAVVEALSASPYANRTWIVKGEADEYCAAAATKAWQDGSPVGATIFTNDSDLIIFDFDSAYVRISMIKELKLWDTQELKVAEVLEFEPTVLAKGFKSLLPMAYLMQDRTVSFNHAFSLVSTNRAELADYQEFEARYLAKRTVPYLRDLMYCRRTGEYFPQLDARIMEPILQAQDCIAPSPSQAEGTTQSHKTKSPAGAISGQEKVQLHLYLPTLFEDPAKGSAWRVGEFSRRTAEVLILNSVSMPAATLLEYRRSGSIVHPAEIQKISKSKVDKQLADCLSILRAYIQDESRLQGVSRWRVSLMKLGLRDLAGQGKILPSFDSVVAVLSRDALSTWGLVHLSAAFQAQFYSLRMLKQVLQHEKQLGNKWEDGGLLDDLPGIAEFFGGGEEVDRRGWEGLVEEFLTREKSEEAAAPVAVARKKHSRGGERTAQTKSNPFAALEELEE
ncbi:hypothetical protein LTR37_001192 [Vermiconidia calcicola]|uniref:Uncharacterized protein n=1 Tax=Vermiconidia calcicola TaxID=1690605 RepID=A0ACC3NVZ2_9PEZI|nr:hypothetical protein LTR37_001192 [Vermiconidia calcicola]